MSSTPLAPRELGFCLLTGSAPDRPIAPSVNRCNERKTAAPPPTMFSLIMAVHLARI